MPGTTTKTKCAVCNEEFTGPAMTIDVNGTSVQVCSDECAAEARDNPTKFEKTSNPTR